MPRGFSLMELIVTIALLAIVLVLAVPNFESIMSRIKMKRMASELNGLLIQAKSEAVTRNQVLYLHFSFASGSNISDGSWHLQLTDSNNSGNQLLYINGASFDQISIDHNYSSAYITFDAVRGRPNGGSILFAPLSDTTSQLKVVISNPPGRIKICGTNGALYDYPACS